MRNLIFVLAVVVLSSTIAIAGAPVVVLSSTIAITGAPGNIRIPEADSRFAIGSKANIPGWEWVNVVNTKPIVQHFTNGDLELVAGSTCGIEPGGTITVLEVQGDSLVVGYVAPGNPLGIACPSGTQFIVAKSDFATMTSRYNAARSMEQSEKELVRQILANNYYGEPMDAGHWFWIDVVNPEPVTQNFSNGSKLLGYGGSCGCGRSSSSSDEISGTIRARGEVNGRVLYEYTARGNPMGTQCPSGVLFFGK